MNLSDVCSRNNGRNTLYYHCRNVLVPNHPFFWEKYGTEGEHNLRYLGFFPYQLRPWESSMCHSRTYKHTPCCGLWFSCFSPARSLAIFMHGDVGILGKSLKNKPVSSTLYMFSKELPQFSCVSHIFSPNGFYIDISPFPLK